MSCRFVIVNSLLNGIVFADDFMYNDKATGELAEWLKAPSWKGGEVKASVSSNLMFSAMCK